MISEYEAVQQDLAQRRRLLAVSERAKEDGRVADESRWLVSLARQREAIREVEKDLECSVETIGEAT